ncbi:MAG: PAS domain S-box protein [Candidatus Delongbacteria bacterium]|nr:PAS domain S-box protein [Candidatus Delongbacteria bacterium]
MNRDDKLQKELECIKHNSFDAYFKLNASKAKHGLSLKFLDYNEKAKKILGLVGVSDDPLSKLEQHVSDEIQWEDVIFDTLEKKSKTVFECHNNKNNRDFNVSIISVSDDTCLFNIQEFRSDSSYSSVLQFNQVLIDNSPIGIVVYEQNGQCILSNKAVANIIGAKSRKEVLSQNIMYIESWKKYGVLDLFEKCINTGEKQRDNIRIVTSFNKELWLDCYFIPVQYKNKQHVMLIVDDNTEAKQYERSIKKNLQQQKLVSKVALRLNSTKNFDDVISQVLECIGMDENADCTYLLFEDDKNDILIKEFEWNQKSGAVKSKIKTKQELKKTSTYNAWKKKLVYAGIITSGDNDIKSQKLDFPEFMDENSKVFVHVPLYFLGIYQGLLGIEAFISNETVLEGSKTFQIISQIISSAFERKIISDNLQASEERFKKISANAQDGIVLVDQDGLVSYWNKAAEDIFGYTKDDIMGKDLHILLSSPSEYKAYKKGMEKFKNSGKGNAFGKIMELQAYTKDKKIIDIELSLSPVKIHNQWHAAGIVRDISKRKETETELRTLYKAVENASAYVVITDTDGNIQYVNKKFTEITGYERDEVIGKNPRILSSGKHAAEFYKHMWDIIKAGGEWKREFINKRKNGELYYESALLSSITDDKGNIVQYIAIKDDITKDKFAQQEVLKAKQEAEEANRTKMVFLANMSHEIRTPINAVIGFSEILSQNLKDQTNLDYVNSINASSTTLLNLINDILDLSKIDTGKMEMHPEITDIRKLIKDITQIFSLKIQQKGLDISISIDPAIPENIIIDELRTKQIFLNIIGNAVKFTDKGHIEIILKRTKTLPGNKINMLCEVKDTGIGIPEAYHSQVFEAFKQRSDHNTRKYGGTGLGLSITKELMEIQGGQITFSSQPGKGSVFKLHFKNVELPGKQTLKTSGGRMETIKTNDITDAGEKPDVSREHVHDFSEKFSGKISTIENSGNMAKIHRLGKDIKMYGKTANNAYFYETGKKLMHAAENIEIEDISSLFLSLRNVLSNK